METLKNDLITTTTLMLRMAQTEQQFVILCDASFHGAGFVPRIEELHQDKREKKIYAPVTFGSQLFNKVKFKLSLYCKEFLAFYFALGAFSHYIWGADKSVLVLTDNKSLTQFFQAKTIQPSLWNFLDRI